MQGQDSVTAASSTATPFGHGPAAADAAGAMVRAHFRPPVCFLLSFILPRVLAPLDLRLRGRPACLSSASVVRSGGSRCSLRFHCGPAPAGSPPRPTPGLCCLGMVGHLGFCLPVCLVGALLVVLMVFSSSVTVGNAPGGTPVPFNHVGAFYCSVPPLACRCLRCSADRAHGDPSVTVGGARHGCCLFHARALSAGSLVLTTGTESLL
jgi:hypothetical protein